MPSNKKDKYKRKLMTEKEFTKWLKEQNRRERYERWLDKL